MSALVKGCSCIILGSGVCALPFLHLSSVERNSSFNLIFGTNDKSQEGRSESWQCFSISGANEIFPRTTYGRVAFSCKSQSNAEGGQGISEIGLEWTIWVPFTALKSAWEFSSVNGKEIVIKTLTVRVKIGGDDVYRNKTTFESEGFNNTKIEGTWGIDIGPWKWVDGEQIYSFKNTESGLEGDSLIYLKVKQ